MGFKTLNVNEVEVKSKNKKFEHYDIKTSVIDSSDFKTDKLGFNIKVLGPGQLSYPYHYHSENEEVYLILDGEVSLRQNGEKKILKEGDFIYLESGESGAHQLFNHTDKPVRYLGVGTKSKSDICRYPDSNKINISKNEIFKLETNVDYYDGEEDVPSFWRKDEI